MEAGSSSSSSIHSLPLASFLSNAFVIFVQKVGEGHFWPLNPTFSKRFENFFLNTVTGDVQYAKVSKPLQARKSAGSRRRPDAAGRGARPFR